MTAMPSIKAAIIVASVASIPALAAPPPGTDLSSETHRWFERQHSVSGKWCCDISDGHVLDDEDWHSNGKFYVVRINGQWFVVDDDALRDTNGGPNPTGKAIVWFTGNDYGVRIYCFCPGTEY